MPPTRLPIFFRNIGARLLLHLLFWLGVAASLTLFFGHFNGEYRYTFLFVCLVIPIAIGTTYFINYVLIPRYLLQKRYTRFVTYFIFTLIISVWAEMLAMIWAFMHLAEYRYSNMNPLTGDIFLLAGGLYAVVFFSTSVKLLKQWYSGEKDLSELRSRQLEAELKLKEAELQLLKGQIHPHFLFNTLNNLYGLALEKSEEMPDAIIRLSGLLDAMLYRSQAKDVSLREELKLIEDYIALEKLRLEERLDLRWKLEGSPDLYPVAPFLLFPFVENAFKHGLAGNAEQLELEIVAVMQEGQFLFRVTNSTAASSAKPEGKKGIGLQNVQRRLQLLYPQQHKLHIQQDPSSFSIRLELQLSPTKTKAYAKQ